MAKYAGINEGHHAIDLSGCEVESCFYDMISLTRALNGIGGHLGSREEREPILAVFAKRRAGCCASSHGGG